MLCSVVNWIITYSSNTSTHFLYSLLQNNVSAISFTISILCSSRSQPIRTGIHVRTAFVAAFNAFRFFRSPVCNLNASAFTSEFTVFVGVVCLVRLDWSEQNGNDFKSFQYLSEIRKIKFVLFRIQFHEVGTGSGRKESNQINYSLMRR